MNPLCKKHYYVKSKDVERWVWAFDELNAAFVVYESLPDHVEFGGYFYVSESFIPEIERVPATIDFFDGKGLLAGDKRFSMISLEELQDG
ncbi:MAG: hypothetical protein ACYSUK_00155 [Planctomycetota bacterium]|jgi:hypothetical protein